MKTQHLIPILFLAGYGKSRFMQFSSNILEGSVS